MSDSHYEATKACSVTMTMTNPKELLHKPYTHRVPALHFCHGH